MTKHINPGADTTINPVVIDDSYRENKGNDANRCYVCGKPFEEGITVHRDNHGWRHADTDGRCTHTPAHHSEAQPPERLCDDCNIIETENKLYEMERQLVMAQERIDAVLAYCNQRHYDVEDDYGIIQEVIPKDEIIALLQAGRK